MNTPEASAPAALVVGAGLCGLTAAWRLKQAGYAVEVFEREDRSSGRVRSIQLAGATVDTGATVFLPAYAETLALIDEMGLGADLQPIRGSVVFPRDGQLHALDLQKPLAALFTRVIGWRSKLSLLRLVWRFVRLRRRLNFTNLGEARDDDLDTLAEYCRKHFPDEVYRYVLNPAIKFLYIHNGETGSTIELLWWMHANGLGQPRSLRRGSSSLSDALAAQVSVHTRSEVSRVARDGDGVTLQYRDAEGREQTARGAVCVVTTPAPVSARICIDGLTPRQRQILAARRYEACTVVSFCTRTRPALDALMFMLPDEFEPDLATVIFGHNIGPQRVPADRGVINAYFMARWSDQYAQADDATVIAAARERLRRWLPEVEDTLAVNVQRWPFTAAIADVGDCARIADYDADIDPDSPIQVIGDFQVQASMNVAVSVANAAVRRLLTRRTATPR